MLDDQFVELLLRWPVKAEKVLPRIQCHHPHDTTWIEFNLHQKMKTVWQMAKTTGDLNVVALRLGMLQRIDDTCRVYARHRVRRQSDSSSGGIFLNRRDDHGAAPLFG